MPGISAGRAEVRVTTTNRGGIGVPLLIGYQQPCFKLLRRPALPLMGSASVADDRLYGVHQLRHQQQYRFALITGGSARYGLWTERLDEGLVRLTLLVAALLVRLLRLAGLSSSSPPTTKLPCACPSM